jgi:hypothetical protein
MSFHLKLVTLIIHAVAEEIAKHPLKTKMTSEQIVNLFDLDDISFSGKSTPAKKELPEWEGDIEDLPAGISEKRARALLALAQAGVPDDLKVHTGKSELFKPNRQHEKFYTKGVFSGPQKDKDVIKWLCKQGEFGAPEEPEVVAELPMHKWNGDKKFAAKMLKLVQEHKKKAESKGEEYKYISWDTSRGHKQEDANFLYNDDYEICGPKEYKSEFLNLIAWLDENADFVEKSRKETPKTKGKKATKSESSSSDESESSDDESEKPKKAAHKKSVKKADKSESSESSESSEKPKKPAAKKAAPKKAAPKEESEESSESSEKPKGRKAAPKKAVPKKDAAPKEDESESSEEKPKGRKAAPKKVEKVEEEEISEESSVDLEVKSNVNDDPDADIDDKVKDDEATIEMDDDDESSCDEVEQKFVLGYGAEKVKKFNAKLAKLLETENDKYLNAKTGFEISRNEKSELKFQWLEAYKIAVPNDLQEHSQAFVDMIKNAK